MQSVARGKFKMTVNIEKLRAAIPITQPPFTLKKLGHVVIKVKAVANPPITLDKNNVLK